MPASRGLRPSDYLIERFENFIRNDFAHLERKVATVDGKVQVILALITVLIAMMASVIVVVVMDGSK